MTVWYLNFCAPFLYDTSGTPQTIRYILYISLIIEFLTYVFFIAKYKLFGQQIPVKNEINIGNEYEDGLHLKKYTVSFAGMGDRQYRLDQKKFKEWYLHYFGLHSIAVAGCIMYSPYTATAVFALLQTALFLVATGMHSCVIEGTTKVVYYVVMVCVAILEVLLLFSLSMGVGASGYDLATRNCHLLQ